jgi:hypothetical protein
MTREGSAHCKRKSVTRVLRNAQLDGSVGMHVWSYRLKNRLQKQIGREEPQCHVNLLSWTCTRQYRTSDPSPVILQIVLLPQ